MLFYKNVFVTRCWGFDVNVASLLLQKAIAFLGGDPAAGSPTATLLRLFPPYKTKIRRSQVDHASPKSRSGGTTGGVCKEQGRIHRALVTRDY